MVHTKERERGRGEKGEEGEEGVEEFICNWRKGGKGERELKLEYRGKKEGGGEGEERERGLM
ncbi:hypothetical protein [Streptococcus pyogenes]|uniref:hypothetical protein n=1 Tax=Streptococcus pyogenes TaxID=1314 RepID=UPI0011E60AB2|nr:hypothetical protein [Streptococcus pyogenes]TYL25542.1 hypothetical protein E0F58_09355 [Streptococcus pyogenes]